VQQVRRRIEGERPRLRFSRLQTRVTDRLLAQRLLRYLRRLVLVSLPII
jgi:hypothetical protein